MRSFVVTLFLLLALSACGDTTPPSELPFAQDSAVEDTAVEVDDRDPIVIENTDLIAFHANWVCELQRRTFSELGDQEVALDSALGEIDVSRPAYEEFVETMADSQAIRDEVLKLYGERCRA